MVKKMHKKNNKKTLSLFLGLFIISMITINTVPIKGMGLIEDIADDFIDHAIAVNETSEFTFKNQFKFQIRTNESINLNMDVDVDAVGQREFALELNTSNAGEDMELLIQVKAENSDIGLKDGEQVKNQNQNQYQYKEKFMVNLSLDKDCEINAQLKLKTQDRNATWAYYNNITEEFVLVESIYIDGEIVATTNHFSIWTVLTPEDEANGLPGYTMIGGFIGIAIVGTIIVVNKKIKK